MSYRNREDIFLRELSWKYILDKNIKELPIDAFVLATNEGHIILNYIEYAKICKLTVDYVIEKYDNDGFIFWSKRHKCYVLCYNSTLPPTVIHWTIMHEIAHVILGHVTSSSPPLSRIRRITHPLFEREADGFARRVICPSIVLHDCKAIEIFDIMLLCGISFEAAQHRSEYMKKLEQHNKWLTDPLEKLVQAQFEPFVINFLANKLKDKFCIEIAA